jgi:cation transport regulator ChaC
MTTNSSTWVFGYGSLVSPASMARTIGRTVGPADVTIAHLHNYGRRWNYGVLHRSGTWLDGDKSVTEGLIVALGLAAGEGESCNGVAIRVTADELAQLDWRERDYDRTDVTDQISVEQSESVSRVVTYVPSPDAVTRYEQARDAGRAAIEMRYWDLVHSAFDELGPSHRALFDTTPAPDVPVVEISVN